MSCRLPTRLIMPCRMVEVFECYPLVDFDGDGIAERRRVLVAGASGNRRILENEEWTEKPPFADLVAVPVAHAWKGRSIADDVADFATRLDGSVRHTLDNLYLTNRLNAALTRQKSKTRMRFFPRASAA